MARTRATKTAGRRCRRRIDYRGVAQRIGMASDPSRLTILLTLAAGDKAVGELGRSLGLNQSPTSRHLMLLRLAGLVEGRARARTRLYHLTDAGREFLTRLRAVVARDGEARHRKGAR